MLSGEPDFVTEAELGECQYLFGVKPGTPQRDVVAAVMMIGMGLLAWGKMVHEWVVGGSIVWWPVLLSTGVTGLGVWVLLRLRSRLLSVDVYQYGLGIRHGNGTTRVPWTELARIEEVPSPANSQEACQILIVLQDDACFLVESPQLEAFEGFVEALRKAASAANVPWQRLGPDGPA